METDISLSELEKRMRPGAYSGVGFLGAGESLAAVLRQDELTLQRLGLTCEQLAAALEKILLAVLEQRDILLKSNYQEYRQREYTGIDWRHQPAPVFCRENMPDPAIGYLVNGKYQVFFIQTRGLQECPWDCPWENTWSSIDFLLLNLGTGEYITAPGLIVHLIRAHQFFEGEGSPYRVEPRELARVLGLGR